MHDRTKFLMDSSGNLNIGGNISATGNITAYSTSDIRLKNNLKKIENSLEKIKKINGYTYEWIEKEDVHQYSGKDTGVVAQEIEEINIPGIAVTRDNGYKAVRYEKLIPLLIESIKSLEEKVTQQQKQIDELMEKNKINNYNNVICARNSIFNYWTNFYFRFEKSKK